MKMNTQVVWTMEIRCLPRTRASVKDRNIPENIFNSSFYSIYPIKMIFCFSEHQRSNLYTAALREVSENAKNMFSAGSESMAAKVKVLARRKTVIITHGHL